MSPDHRLTGAEEPARAVFVAPHPDDIAISTGALAVVLNRRRAPHRMILATDGSEARIPESVLEGFGWEPHWPVEQTRALRGRIRVEEGREEALRLGFPARDGVVVLTSQGWHSDHATEDDALHDDLSLRDVDRFAPGPVDEVALREMADAIAADGPCWLAIPHPADRLLMHRIVAGLALRAVADMGAQVDVLCYEALSNATFELPAGWQPVTLEFDDGIGAAKRSAILAHRSMAERRRVFGGYSTAGRSGYDMLADERGRRLARVIDSSFPAAERFALWRDPSSADLRKLATDLLNARPRTAQCS